MAKGFPLESAIEGSNDHNNSLVGQSFRNFNDVREELALIDSNNIVFLGSGVDGLKSGSFECLHCESIYQRVYLSCVEATSPKEYLLSLR